MKALCNSLEAQGYRPTGYSSSRQALAQLRPGAYEVLLTDLLMPELDGIELIAAARALDPQIASVVMTGHGTIDTAVAAMQVGASDYVLKPFKLNVILTIIGRALDIRSLRIQNAALQRREREQAAELAAAYRDLESFTYSVSHDLRSPLRAIRGFTDLCLAEFGGTLPEGGRLRLGQVLSGAQRMDRLIEDLLKFCRFSRAPLRKQTVDLDLLVRRLAADLKSGEPQRRIEVRIGELPPCEGDASLLEQVVINLLSNAFKFTRDTQSASIEVGSCEPADAAQSEPAVSATQVVDSEHGAPQRIYFVRDNGCGFDMQHAGKLFGVFQRLHSSEEFEGTGVGLSIVQRILQRHGGRIWAQSAPGRGATFYFAV